MNFDPFLRHQQRSHDGYTLLTAAGSSGAYTDGPVLFYELAAMGAIFAASALTFNTAHSEAISERCRILNTVHFTPVKNGSRAGWRTRMLGHLNCGSVP